MEDVSHALTALLAGAAGALGAGIPPLIAWLKARSTIREHETDSARKIREADAQFQSEAWRQIVKDLQKNYGQMQAKVTDLQRGYEDSVSLIETNFKRDMSRVEERERHCLEDNAALARRVQELEAKIK